ncbi:MAG: hypothetical protein WC721_19005 [Victivallaceae bacterium]
MGVNTEKHYAQRLSKVSEWAVQNGFGVVPSVPDGAVSRDCGMRNGCPKCVRKLSKMCCCSPDGFY